MSRFLVTGGAGFIGSHIVEKLVGDRHYVRVLDNFSRGKEANLKPFSNKIDLLKGDIRSKDVCLKAAKGIDFVMHQAALMSVPESMVKPREYNEVNISGTLNMLEASRSNKIKRFIFASSSSVYGETSSFPEKEGFLPAPISPYALTKLAGEHYCNIFSIYHKLPAISLRYFNVFGPRQSLNDEYAVVVPKFINCMLKGERPPVYGTGKQSRDFTFVSNVVNANLLAAGNKSLRGGVFNIASGKDHTVLELVAILNKIFKKRIKPAFLNKRPGDVFRTFADLSQARKILGFKPEVDFIRGLCLTIDYWRDNA